MAAHRFFLENVLSPRGGEVTLPLSDADVHHAVSVLRVRPGEELEVVHQPSQGGWRVRVTSSGLDGLTAEILGNIALEPSRRVTLVQGVAKGDKMDTIVRQAVEVGATEVLPLLTSRVVVRLNEEKRRARGDRWRRIAKSAAEQSRRSQVAVVHDPMPLRDALAMLDEYDAVVVVWEKAPSTAGLWDAIAAFGLHAGSRLALVIGPEGGLSDEEVAALAAVGGVPVTLGAGILRTETAAVVALALCQHALVELGVTGE